MKIETYPLIVGAIVALIGLLLLFDAWTPDETVIPSERRRARRAERSRGGETAIGFGVLCLAAAILGRDSWAYSIVVAIAGAALLLIGGIMSRRYIKGRLVTYVDAPGTAATKAAVLTDRELPREAVRDVPATAAAADAADADQVTPDAQPLAPDSPPEPPEPAPGKRLRIR